LDEDDDDEEEKRMLKKFVMTVVAFHCLINGYLGWKCIFYQLYGL